MVPMDVVWTRKKSDRHRDITPQKRGNYCGVIEDEEVYRKLSLSEYKSEESGPIHHKHNHFVDVVTSNVCINRRLARGDGHEAGVVREVQRTSDLSVSGEASLYPTFMRIGG